MINHHRRSHQDGFRLGEISEGGTSESGTGEIARTRTPDTMAFDTVPSLYMPQDTNIMHNNASFADSGQQMDQCSMLGLLHGHNITCDYAVQPHLDKAPPAEPTSQQPLYVVDQGYSGMEAMKANTSLYFQVTRGELEGQTAKVFCGVQDMMWDMMAPITQAPLLFPATEQHQTMQEELFSNAPQTEPCALHVTSPAHKQPKA